MALQHWNTEAFREAVQSAPLVMVDFWADWCGPCRMLGPVVEQLAEEYEGRVLIGKVNVDQEMELARQFYIRSIPTVVLLKDGREIERKVGVMPGQAYSDLLDRNL